MCVCVCVCVRKREAGKEGVEREREREGGREGGRKREYVLHNSNNFSLPAWSGQRSFGSRTPLET